MADDLHDSYRVLQLEPGASLPTVKRAYRHLVKMWHPDHFAPGSKMELKAQEKLKEINRAYEQLCTSRGQKAAGESAASERAKKARKSASPSEEEPAGPKRSSSKKAEEEPMASPARGPMRRMGDLDEEPPPASAGPAPQRETETAARPPPPETRFRGGSRTRRRSLLAAAVLLAGALLILGLPRRPRNLRQPPTPPSPPILPSAPAGEGTASVAAAPSAPDSSLSAAPGTPSAAAPGAPSAGKPAAVVGRGISSSAFATFTVGSSKEEVMEIQGKPDSFTETRFLYGSSEVVFQDGRVESWKDGSPRLKARKPLDLSALNLDTFTLGSRKDEVVAVQGKPDAVTDTTFQYGSSVVIFRNDRVESWRDGSPRLKVRQFPAVTAADPTSFTVGSRKDEVVAVQGLPDTFTDRSFQYGTSTVFFEDGRVVSWVDGDPRLKAKKP